MIEAEGGVSGDGLDRAPHQVLVAGIGNIFLSDDGFGVEVVKRLAAEALPDWVRVADFGIRGLHLAYDLLDRGYATTIMVDALPRGGEPGTVYLLEPELSAMDASVPAAPDAHGMDPSAVFAFLRSLGGVSKRTLIVGCEPAILDEGIGLSDPVARSVDEAIRLIKDVLGREDH